MNEEDNSRLEFSIAIIFFVLPVGLFINSLVMKLCLWILNLHS